MPIRGVIFDYGGVIWDMRWDVARELSLEHGLDERALVEAMYRNKMWRSLEVGVGDRDAWLMAVQAELDKLAGRAIPALHHQWQDRQHLIAPNVELIKKLRPAYRTQVLSNADVTLRKTLRVLQVDGYFDDIVVSGEVGVAKPDASIYTLAAKRLGLPAGECVFVDDLEANVVAAQEAGMTGVHFRVDEGHDLGALLVNAGVDV